jgi:hypothetical protein
MQMSDSPLLDMKGNSLYDCEQRVVTDEYLLRMSKPGEWGDELVLAYASTLYQRSIKVICTNGSSVDFNPIHQKQDECRFSTIILGFVKSLGSSTENHFIYLEPKHPADGNIEKNVFYVVLTKAQ